MENRQGRESKSMMDTMSSSSEEVRKNMLNKSADTKRLNQKEASVEVIQTELSDTVVNESLSSDVPVVVEVKLDSETLQTEKTEEMLCGEEHVEMDSCNTSTVEKTEENLEQTETENNDQAPVKEIDGKQNVAITASVTSGVDSSENIKENKLECNEMESIINSNPSQDVIEKDGGATLAEDKSQEVIEKDCGTTVAETEGNGEEVSVQMSENDIAMQMDYRGSKESGPAGDDSSDTEDSSSDSDAEVEEAGEEKKAEGGQDSTSKQINKAFSTRDESPETDKRVKMNRHGFEDIRTKGELLPEELPPLEELTITVDETVEMKKVGSVKSIVGILVIIQTCENVPPLNDDTILFLEGRKVLGQVFEVFGPVQAPWYSVRFNKEENIKSKGIEVGMPIFCAPREDSFTTYVFVNSLKQMKGSDASWDDNNEPPAKYVEYSDDDDERAAKSKNKKKKQKHAISSEPSEDCLPQMEKRSRNQPHQNDQSHQNDRRQNQQPGSYRPRNPFQGSNTEHSRPRHLGGYNPRPNHNNRDSRWGPPQGNGQGTPAPSFGGQPRFQPQMHRNDGSRFTSGNTQQSTGFQSGSNFEGNSGQMFPGNVRPGISPAGQGTGSFSTQGNPGRPQNPPVNQNQLPWQKNSPFRTDIPPPAFNMANVQNDLSSQNRLPLHNSTVQNQFSPSHNPVNQNNAPNQSFVSNSSQQPFRFQGQNSVSQMATNSQSFPQNVANSNSFPQNATNSQFGNGSYRPLVQSPQQNQFQQSPNLAGQFGNNSSNQFQSQNSNNQFQNNFPGTSPTMFQGNTNQNPAFSNQTQSPHLQNSRFSQQSQVGTGNQQSPFPGRNQMKIHSLNPGLQSNTQTRSGSGGYDEVKMGGSTIKPYRPEIAQHYNGGGPATNSTGPMSGNRDGPMNGNRDGPMNGNRDGPMNGSGGMMNGTGALNSRAVNNNMNYDGTQSFRAGQNFQNYN